MEKYDNIKRLLSKYRENLQRQLSEYNSYVSLKQVFESLREIVIKRKRFVDEEDLKLLIKSKFDALIKGSNYGINYQLRVGVDYNFSDNRNIYAKLCQLKDCFSGFYYNDPKSLRSKSKIERMKDYESELNERGIKRFNYEEFIKFIDSNYDLFSSNLMAYLESLFIKARSMDGLSRNTKDIDYIIKGIFYDFCTEVANYVLDKSEIYFDNKADKFSGFDSEETKNIMKQIDKYLSLLSKDVVFTDSEMQELEKLIGIVAGSKELKVDIMGCIKKENEAKKNNADKSSQNELNKRPVVTFDNLNMSIFTFEETMVIERIKQLILINGVGNKSYGDVELTSDARIKAYGQDSIKTILSDVSYLLNYIYDNKTSVIEIFKAIIQKYVDFVREKQKVELEKLKAIIEKTAKNIYQKYSKIYAETGEYIVTGSTEIHQLNKIKEDIEETYIPTLEDHIEEKGDFDYIDEGMASVISEIKERIAKIVEKENLDNIDIRSNNLVLCLDNLDLSDQSFRDGFNDATTNIEYRDLHDIRIYPNGRGLITLRNNQEDLAKYLRRVTGRRPNFMPHVYFGEKACGTCLVEFSPSPKVKEHLAEKFGILNEGSCYGIFRMISEDEVERNGYDNLTEDLVKSFYDIKAIADLLVNDNPTMEDLKKIDNIIESKLLTKKMLKLVTSATQK